MKHPSTLAAAAILSGLSAAATAETLGWSGSAGPDRGAVAIPALFFDPAAEAHGHRAPSAPLDLAGAKGNGVRSAAAFAPLSDGMFWDPGVLPPSGAAQEMKLAALGGDGLALHKVPVPAGLPLLLAGMGSMALLRKLKARA